jgi:serine/threonine protein kinase
MTPERHQLVCELLSQALDLEPGQRDAFLDRVGSSDHALRSELESLLSSSDKMRSDFLRLSTVRLIAPGTKWGDCEIESLIDSGGMGDVYRARDLQLPRDVAVKVISSYLLADQKQVRRFEQEAQAIAALNHPSILTIYRAGNQEGVPYLVSELLEGETLRKRLARGRIAPPLAVDLAVQIASGLAAAHDKGIIHRDLKPENLYITKDGRAKILDFGLAKLTQELKGLPPGGNGLGEGMMLYSEPGVIMGTVGYMSPEQARGQPVDARSDIFCFGAVLYEMITGKPAFQRQTKADSISSILSQQPPAISRTVKQVSPALQRVIARCLEKQAELRYQQTSELVQALKSLPKGRTINPPKAATIALMTMTVLAVLGVIYGAPVITRIRGLLIKDSQPEVVERNLTANQADNPVRAAAITRDGNYVAYIDNSDKVNLLQVSSGDARPLALDSSYTPLQWFPDGVHLLVAQKGGQPGLWKFSTWDSSLHKLSDSPVTVAAISPDGSSIALVKTDNVSEIWTMGAGGEEPHKTATFDAKDELSGLAWSPNGRRLGYVRARGTYDKHDTAVGTCDLSGGDRVEILSEPRLMGRDGVKGIAWLADGRIVYSISTRLDEYNLFAIETGNDGRTASGKPQPITSWKDFVASSFQVTADGRHLIVLKSHSEDAVFTGSLAQGAHDFAPKRLTADHWRNFGTAWMPDSKSILLYSQRNGSYAIRKQKIDGSSPETLVDGPENYRYPVSSSTGILLYTAFSSTNGIADPKSWRLMSTPLSGGPRTLLLQGRYGYECGSAPSSPCVMSDSQSDGQLIFDILDPARGKGDEIARLQDYQSQIAHWNLSPRGTEAVVADTAQHTLRVLNLKDHKVTTWPVHILKTESVSSVGWAADAKQLLAILYSESTVKLVYLDAGGETTNLYEIPAERAFLTFPIGSPDGRYLAFSQRSYISDLVLLEKF